MMKRSLVLSILLPFLLVISVMPIAFASFPGPNGLIAFIDDRSGNDDIWVMNPDGSNQRQLTTNTADDDHPSWSPDGSRIAFTSDRDGNQEIYVMFADGSGQTRLTNNNSRDHMPAFSPDGTKIVFCSWRDTGSWQIYVMDAANGGNLQRLTNNAADDMQPRWSPDGSKIVFASDRDGGPSQIYVMDSDGGNQQRLTDSNTIDFQPDWSPDGSMIVFSSGIMEDECIDYFDIYVMSATGTGVTSLTNTKDQSEFRPAWSPDGTKITFCWYPSEGCGYTGIVSVINADGSNYIDLTDGNSDAWNSNWGTYRAQPVGGEILPVNMLQSLAPFLAYAIVIAGAIVLGTQFKRRLQ